MTHFLERLKRYQLPLISGLLVATSYPPFPSWAVVFCWVPLWLFCWKQKSWKTAFWAGWATQFTLSLIGFHWVAYTAHAFGNLPWIVAVPVLLLFAAFVHLHIPLALALINWLRKDQDWPAGWVFLSYACAISLLERIWPMIFSWNMGYSLLYSRLEIYQLAEWVGFEGLSAFLFALNAVVATGLVAWQTTRRGLAIGLMAATCLLFLLFNVVGSKIRPADEPPERTLKALIVQANVGQFDKVMAEQNLKGREGELPRAVQDLYLRLTEEALARFPETELIVWPETALADYFDLDYLNRDRAFQLRSRIQSWNRAVVTGAYSRDPQTQGVYNAVFGFNHDGALAANAYRKYQLLAFGEYLPGSEFFPILLKWIPFVSNFARGPGPEVKPLQTARGTFKIAPQICYESLSPAHSRLGALAGGEVLVNVTNDSWFGKEFEPFQHGTMTWARAIETRRPLIRATNTGQSSIITHRGEVLIKSPLGVSWAGMAEVPVPAPKITFFMKYGYLDWVPILVILLFVIGRMRYRENTRRSVSIP
ncbi:MAG: apolipoprotein N-acyltransferase [Bdellovibrionales bacterium]